MSERQVRLLRATSCRVCHHEVPAGTVTWWDDERRSATCTSCFVDTGPEASSRPAPERALRRARLLRATASA